MKLFEEWMIKHMKPDLKPVEPILLPGVHKVIAYFHGECCFHTLDYKRTAWLVKGQTDNAQQIIYPGSKEDAWWDTEQLMKQMDCTIEIYNAVHPNATTLFIFDQSSAHTSLPSDALHAWEMNMSDGGKQKPCKDTIIPALNLYPEYCGKVQKMMMAMGQVKGMKTVLMEMHYWGWCKYCYHQIPKKTFKESKELVKKYLDACPFMSGAAE
ncbi:hypothetical protein ARMGADRAFT_1049119 [Armillaria gallica]|uniref:DDE-1 domain-containing protein n=1 Tax=Armillaria gallica TaxID=47427 RepID=A0A2H3CE72_ARMGA|nr:hypothetical protein ARMGADRAFT_1049119 [Armillaria gallica]